MLNILICDGMKIMWEKAKDNYIRVFYILACIVITWVFFEYKLNIIGTNENMNLFSFYASVATVIALIITVMEILNNVSITKSIKSRSMFNLTKFKDATGISYAHECASYYDQCLNDLATKKYPLLVANFTIAKKLHISLANHFMSDEDKKEFESKKESLYDLEKKIISTRHITPKTPLGNAQITEIQVALLEVKKGFETKYTFKKSED